MQTTLTYEFNLPEDKEDFKIQTQASAMYSALWDISQRVFRPARKHGYPDKRIAEVLEAADTVQVKDIDYDQDTGAGTELVSLLEKLFYEILQEHDVEIN